MFVTFCRNELDGEITFESGSVQPDPTNDLLEEMKSFNITDTSEASMKKGKIISFN